MEFTLFNGVLSELQNLILREPIFSYRFNGPYLSSHSLITCLLKEYLGSIFTCVHKGVLVNIQGFIRVCQ